MIERNVGDIITHDSHKFRGVRLWEIISFTARTMQVRVVQHEMSRVDVGRLMTKMNNSSYILYREANPNHITVQASTFKDEDGLTQEDKQIIKEYLDDKAA